jgi:hypothetical protein
MEFYMTDNDYMQKAKLWLKKTGYPLEKGHTFLWNFIQIFYKENEDNIVSLQYAKDVLKGLDLLEKK